MRLLLLNPNTSQALTDRLAAVAATVAPPGVVIDAVTAPRGFPYISNIAEAQVAGAIVLEMLARHAGRCDAAIVGAFGDPGLRAARALFPFPVIGISEAAIVTAAMTGRRFGVVGFTTRMRDWYVDCVAEVGMERRFAGFRAPAAAPRAPATAQHDLREELLACVRDSHAQDGADVVIMAGAPLAGFAATAAAEVPAPLVDPVAAAVLQAHALALLAAQGCGAPRPREDPKPTTGLDPALAARFLGAQDGRAQDGGAEDGGADPAPGAAPQPAVAATAAHLVAAATP
jgi:allantoin racemase